MEFIYILLHVISLVLLFMAMGIYVARTKHSRFEIRRRVEAGDVDAKSILRREKLLQDVHSLQRVVVALLLVLASFLAVQAYHPFAGVIISLFVALEAGVVSHWSTFQRFSQKVYDRYEGNILHFIESHPTIFKMIRTVSPPVEDGSIDSKEELEHMVQESEDVFTDKERKRMLSVLSFSDKKVSDIMIPRSVVSTISDDENLGPLVMDELHKTGHSRFPVISGDIDHVVGILYIHDLLNIEIIQKNKPVKEVMSSKVFYIKQDQTLESALQAFLSTRHHLFIVINEYRETVGILSLEDVMEVLLGSPIIDEFDSHEDLKKVALRNTRKNNLPKNHKTIS